MYDDASQQTLVLSTKALTQHHYLETVKTPVPEREQPAHMKVKSYQNMLLRFVTSRWQITASSSLTNIFVQYHYHMVVFCP